MQEFPAGLELQCLRVHFSWTLKRFLCIPTGRTSSQISPILTVQAVFRHSNSMTNPHESRYNPALHAGDFSSWDLGCIHDDLYLLIYWNSVLVMLRSQAAQRLRNKRPFSFTFPIPCLPTVPCQTCQLGKMPVKDYFVIVWANDKGIVWVFVEFVHHSCFRWKCWEKAADESG